MTDSTKAHVCIDLTSNEMKDRFGGIGRYGILLTQELEALVEQANLPLKLSCLYRSHKEPAPGALALADIMRDTHLISSRRHRAQRRFLSGRRLNQAQVTLFHATQPQALPLQKSYKIVATAHDIIPIVYPRHRDARNIYQSARHKLALRLRYRYADHIIAISEVTKQDMVRELGIQPEKLSVVHHGVDMQAFATRADDHERAYVIGTHRLPEKWLICVSSDHYRKNHLRLFEAWASVADQIDEGLVFVGKALYENTLESIHTEVKRRGLEKRFRWLDNISDLELPALYRQATASVAPSFYEGFGMTILESMACGTPVVAASNPAYREVGGSDALYFDPYDVDELAETIVRITQSTEQQTALRTRGLERAKRFSWKNAAAKTLDVYRSVLGM